MNGRLREISTKTPNYQGAKRLRRKALEEQDQGRLPEGEVARWPFQRTAQEYLKAAAIRLRPSSLRKESFFLVRPLKLFGAVPCDRLTGIHIRRLQSDMKSAQCQHSYINLVMGAAVRVLKFAKVWRRIEDDVSRLPERKSPVARVLSPEQKKKLFDVAATNPNWTSAYAAALISANTTARGCDLRALLWSDMDWFEQTASITDSKTEAGVRRVPLNRDALVGFRILKERAAKLGIDGPNCYVLPACEHWHFDPNRPQKTWRSAWRALTKAAGLKGLRFHDLRHQCVTELLEKGAPEQTVMALAGHVSKRMLEHYSHIRMEAKREAVQLLAPVATDEAEDAAISRPN